MGWWRNEAGDALGDGPVDDVSLALQELNATLGHKLRLGELLAAIELVLNAKGADLLNDDGARGLSIRAVLDVGGAEITIEAEHDLTEVVRDAIDELCGTISNEYVEILGQRPTCRELIATFSFALASGTDCVDVPDDAHVANLACVRR